MKRLILLLVLLWAAPAQAVDYWGGTEGFEGATLETSGWSYVTPGWCSFTPPRTNPCAEIDSVSNSVINGVNTAFSGSKSLKMTFNLAWSDPNPQSNTQRISHQAPLNTALLAAGKQLWVTYRMRLYGFTPGQDNTKLVYYRNNGSGSPNGQSWAPGNVSEFKNGRRSPSLAVQGYAGVCYSNGLTYDSCVFNPNLSQMSMSNDVWYCVEEGQRYNDIGQSNGFIRFYINGTQTLGYESLLMIGDTLHTTNGSSYNGPDSTTDFVSVYKQNGGGSLTRAQAGYTGGPDTGYGVIYMDDMRVTDTRVGCTGGGVVIINDTTPPSTVTASSSVNSGTQATITWTAATDNVGVTGYQVLRCTGSCTPTVVLTTKSGSTLAHVDTTLSPGLTYTYRIRATDAAGLLGPASNSTAVTTPSAATGSFRRTLATDDFTRANNTDLGASWTDSYNDGVTHTNASIVSNRLRHTALNASEPKAIESYSGVATPNDQWCQVTLASVTQTGDWEYGCTLRMANSPTISWYFCYARPTSAVVSERIGKHVGAVGTNLTTTDTNTPWAVGDKIRCEVQGTALKLYRLPFGTTQEILLQTATDSAITTGKTGILMWMQVGGDLATVELDDFAMGDFTGTADTGTFDATSNSATGNTTNSISWSHTTGTASNRALVVCAQARDTVAADTVATSMTYAGQALTIVRNDLRDDGTTRLRTTIGYLVAPPSGTNTVNITWAAALSAYGVGTATSWSGVDQVSPLDANNGANGSSTTPAATVTTVANNAMIVDCVVDQSSGLVADAAHVTRANRETTGPSVDSTGVSSFSKATAGAESMNWTATTGNWAISALSLKPGVSTPVVPPSIVSVDAGATSALIGHGPTVSTSIRVRWEFGTVVEPIASFPSGVYTYPSNVLGTLTNFICFDAMDAIGQVFNTICDSVPIVTLDTTPVVMSAAFPTVDLPAGTTSATIGFTIDKIAPCRWNATDTTYALMDPATQQMEVANLTASATVTGLSAGTTTYKGRCNFTNSNADEYPNLTSITMTVTVAASTADVTAPTTVTNLVATALSNSQASLTWTAATDAGGILGYRVFQASGDCSTYTLASPTLVPTTTIQVTLAPSAIYCWKVLAVDMSSNVSAAYSNIATITTSGVVDITAPTNPANLSLVSAFTQGAILEWTPGSDESGTTFSTLEISTAGCSDYLPVISNTAIAHFTANLAAGTAYCARVFATDPSGNRSPDFSNEITFTTATTGLTGPRSAWPFGVERSAADRGAAGTRAVRP